MSDFATLTKRKQRHYTDAGSREANDYQIVIDKKGHKILKLTGTHDIYEDIQSYAEECDIKNIIVRASAGDTEILNKRQGFYADITNFPKNLAEAQNQILKLKQGFDGLPSEIREKFDNSAEKFVNDFGTKEWTEAMGFKEEAAQKTNQVTFDGMKTAEPLTPGGTNE